MLPRPAGTSIRYHPIFDFGRRASADKLKTPQHRRHANAPDSFVRALSGRYLREFVTSKRPVCDDYMRVCCVQPLHVHESRIGGDR